MATTFRSKKDNAKSLITNNPLTSGGLSITLTATEGSKFPSTGQFVVTLWDNTTYSDPGDDPTMEKILCDSISGDTITVNASGRGYDGTSGVAHPQGTRIALLNISKDFTDVETAVNSIENVITPASASAPASIALAEDTDNGTNKITVTAPSSIDSDKTITLPDATDTLVGRNTTDILTNKTLTSPVIQSWDGWQLTSETVTYTAAQQVTVSSALAALLQKGAKFKCTNDGSTKYFYVSAVSGTTVNLAGEVDLANSAITNVYFSYADCPFGFKRGEDWYKASMRISSTKSIPATGTYTKLPAETKSYDPNSDVDTTTNYRYDVPVNGTYNISAQCQVSGVAESSAVVASIYVNGIVRFWGTRVGYATSRNDWVLVSTSCNLYLNKGDYVELYVRVDATTNRTATAADGLNVLDIQFIGV